MIKFLIFTTWVKSLGFTFQMTKTFKDGRASNRIFNQRNRHRQKYQFYVNVFDFLNESSIAGDYFEFGCHRVRTFRMALTEARRHHMTDMRFLGI